MAEPNPQSAGGPLIVVSGPSGVGKTTVVDGLLARGALRLRRAVTATTRDRRPGEADGVDYHFWTAARFLSAVAADRMLEWARVFDSDYYGTPRAEVDPHRAAGVGVVLVIDVQGAATVRGKCPDALSVFITPPSLDELEGRLRGRGDMPEERVLRRLDAARRELARQGEFDHVVINRDVPAAVAELEGLVRSRFTT